MTDQNTLKQSDEVRNQHFMRLKADYEKLLEYQHTHPQSVLFIARTIAENICFHLVEQETSHPPKGLTLHALIGKLIQEKALSSYVLAPLRAIQYYGNLGAHYQDDDQGIPPEYVHACLYSAFGLVSWYFETYWPEGERVIPFPVHAISSHDVHQTEVFRKTQDTAILVLMFLDMVSSTEIRETLGEEAFERLRDTKKDHLRAIIEQEEQGKLVKDLGDGYLAVFSVPGTAVKRALEIQERLHGDSEYQVRIGLDMGQVTQESIAGITHDVFGRHVNRAARIESLGEGGHILTSYPVWDSAKGWLKQDERIAWKRHGSYRLKGIADPQEIYEAYNSEITDPLEHVNGAQVADREALTYCVLCGRHVELPHTFRCRTCGREQICTAYCLHAEQRQCLECASQPAAQQSNLPRDAQKLLDLENPDASFNIRIWTERENTRATTRNMLVAPKREFGQYRLGDTVAAYFESSTDVYVYMFNIGPTGDITHILPNDYTSDNRIKGGRQHTFPDEKAPFEWILQEPAGTETIKVIATKVPVNIDRFLNAQNPTVRNIGIRPKSPESLRPDQWAEASCTLLVQR